MQTFSTNVSDISVGLIEADALHRDSLCQSLRQHAFSIAFACSSPEAIPPTAQEVDLLLLCSNCPADFFGEDLALDYWFALFPTARLFMLSKSRARRVIKRLVDGGIHGYGVRDAVALQDLIELLIRSCNGEQVLCPVTVAVLNQSIRSDLKFTPTEIRIISTLANIGTGYGKGKEAAHMLHMDIQTFRSHTRNICAKLEISTLAEILPKCREAGVIESRLAI